MRRVEEVEKEMNEINEANWNLVFRYQATGDPQAMRSFFENTKKINDLLDEYNQIYKIIERSAI